MDLLAENARRWHFSLQSARKMTTSPPSGWGKTSKIVKMGRAGSYLVHKVNQKCSKHRFRQVWMDLLAENAPKCHFSVKSAQK